MTRWACLVSLWMAGCGSDPGGAAPAECTGKCDSAREGEEGDFEYIVVGSGAGGGPLAANLARAGHRVLLLEAGADTGGSLNYQVPAFHALATEDPAMRWDYFVSHYDDFDQAQRDSKMTFVEDEGHMVPSGILYPRAGTLGGCTAHNAMITVYPHDGDWYDIAQITGDRSWREYEMRRYFERLERNNYLSGIRQLRGHGSHGWLQTEQASAWLALHDSRLRRMVIGSALQFVDERERGPLSELWADAEELIGVLRRDLNSADPERDYHEGLFRVPIATRAGRRNGPREWILETVAEGYPLTVRTHALVTNVVFDEDDTDGPPRVSGVEFLDGSSLYRADPRADTEAPLPEKVRVLASREVILAAGAFNTPQLLMLSGIGPREELERFGLDVVVDLPGVGTNLQDRYEVSVVTEMDDDLELLEGCTFGQPGDPCLDEWDLEYGPYESNGSVVAIVRSSSVAADEPDLIIFGLPGDFRGYYPGYSDDAISRHNRFTWAVLKAHTRNQRGSVTLRSADPRDRPDIRFRYFEGTVGDDLDMQAMVEGVEFVRRINGQYNELASSSEAMVEVYPGPEVGSSEEIATYVRDQSWGHHACCTAPMGADDDPMAVLDSRFRVRGVESLRVVDASVFPEIPGFFIVTPIYMASEKASDVILEDAER